MDKPTPGPWEWMRDGSGRYMLATPDRGQLIVMDFVRMGMGGAQPRFATWKGEERERMGGIMLPASKLVLGEHPDARRIVAAVNATAGIPTEALEAGAVKDVLAACEAAYSLIDPSLEVSNQLAAAIRKASGKGA